MQPTLLRCRRRIIPLLCTSAAVATLAVSTTSLAAERTPEDACSLKTGGGIWATSLNGTVGVRNVESDVDADFSDLFDKTNFAFNPVVEVDYGKWVFLFQGSIAKLEDSKTFKDGRGGDIDMTLGVFDLGVGYTVWETSFGDMPFSLTPLVGGQITYLKLELDPRNFGSADRDRTWFDPYVGARAVLAINREWDWRTQATIGGFGVGSDLTWSAGTYLDWEFAKGWSLNVGYKAVNWDYDDDNFKWDMTMHGPWIGLTHEWF